MADHPLRPATDRRLGGPLPRQLANRTRAPLEASFPFGPQATSGISRSFPRLFRTSRQVPTRYSPVRHSLVAQGVRLACVRHAASVRSEPGSNSQVNCPGRSPSNQLKLALSLITAPQPNRGSVRTLLNPSRNQSSRTGQRVIFKETRQARQRFSTPPPAYPFLIYVLVKEQTARPANAYRAAKGGTFTLPLKASQAPVTNLPSATKTCRSHRYRSKIRVDKPPAQKRL